MFEWAMILGGFIRWLSKACKSSLRDEIEGNYTSNWAGSADVENCIIGLITTAILLILIVNLIF